MWLRHVFFFFITFLILVMIGIPLALVRQLPGRQAAAPPSPSASLTLVQDGQLPVNVYLNDQKKLVRLPLEEYLKGVVAAEMPASFGMEALKAQAVVARTFTVNRMRVFGGPGCDAHPAADVCTDPARSQAWRSREELRKRWGVLRFTAYWRKVEQAVEETEGLIAVYDGQPIDAVYHAASGGRTEDAGAVWGRQVPYLVSVASPFEEAPRYDHLQVRLTLEEVASRLEVPVAEMEERHRQGIPPVVVLERSASGRAVRVRVGEREFSGRDLRSKLGLASTLLTVRRWPGGVEFETRGYGHGVGMSQYGAEGLARQGKGNREIIQHYYPGADVRRIFVE